MNRLLWPACWTAAIGIAVAVRAWNALAGPRMWGYDAWGHVAYALFLDLYRAIPWADQGWSYFHPPFHYALGWVLAQSGSGEVLMRGLSVLGSAASLGTAALAAWLVRRTAPERPALALLAFGTVAFVPVHLFLSPMPGNETTETFLTAAAITAFLANERRPRPALRGDLLTALLLALALLTKFSGLLPLLVIVAALGLRPWLWGRGRGERMRSAGRAALIAGVALALAAPYYARNIASFGTPFQLSRGDPLIVQVERDQPPGLRTWRDYASFPSELFADPNPLAPHMLRSVWGTAYANVWADVFRESDVVRALEAELGPARSNELMTVLGLLPSGLALMGAGLAARDAWRGRRRPLYVTLLLLAGASLASFAAFTWRVPLWSALKASYLMALSLPCAVFVARSGELLAGRASGWLRAGVPVALAGIALAGSAVATSGLVRPRRADAPATGAVHFYFGEYEKARSAYQRLATATGFRAAGLDGLAAVHLATGDAEGAAGLYARVLSMVPSDPYREGQLAVAQALSGETEAARVLLDRALARSRLPELLVNRGAIRAALGDLGGAEGDLRAALEIAPALLPGWHDLAEVLERAGRREEAAAARVRAARERCRPPRGYPYGLGTGEVIEWGVGRRWMLLFEGGGLRVALPGFYRRWCARSPGEET